MTLKIARRLQLQTSGRPEAMFVLGQQFRNILSESKVGRLFVKRTASGGHVSLSS
jgi:hypothetical protein